MKLVGLSGKKGSGKTTAAKYIQSKLSVPYMPTDWPMFGFFDTAKDWFKRGLGLPDGTDLNDQIVKSRVLPGGLTVREALQKFGTDYCRSIDPDWWVNVWSHWIEDWAWPGLIVPDVRFFNELKAIQDRGGHVIRLLRAPHPEDAHETETALDEIELVSLGLGIDRIPSNRAEGTAGEVFDAVIDNREMPRDQMCETVWKLCNERNWV